VATVGWAMGHDNRQAGRGAIPNNFIRPANVPEIRNGTSCDQTSSRRSGETGQETEPVVGG
jgi:hypothetical protein